MKKILFIIFALSSLISEAQIVRTSPTWTNTSDSGYVPVFNKRTGRQYKIQLNGIVDTASALKTKASASADSGILRALINSNTITIATKLIDKTVANTYTAGAKQTFGASATAAGVNWAGVTANPSSLSAGDLWYRNDENKFRYYDGTTARAFVTEQLTQTLTNKTLSNGSIIADTVAKVSGLPRQVFVSNVALSNTGSTTENTMATFTLPGSALGVNGIMEVRILISATNNANAKFVKMRWNGVNVAQSTIASNATFQHVYLIRNRNSQVSQITGTLGGAVGTTYAASSGAVQASSINTAADITVTFTAQCQGSSSDTITIESIQVLAY